MIAHFRMLLSKHHQIRRAAITFGSTVMLTGLLVTGAISLIRQLGLLEAAELDAYDWLIRTRPDEGLDDRFLVVGITEDDVQRRQEYPVHDSTVAELLARLQQYKPRAIALDVARDVPQGDGRDALIRELTSSDRIIVGCTLSSAAEPGVPPLPEISPDQVGFADLPLDAKGIVRRSIIVSTPAPTESPLASNHLCSEVNPENQLLSIGLLLALIYLEDEGVAIQQTDKGDLQLGSVVLQPLDENTGGYQRNGATDYQLMLNYRSAENAVRVVSLTDVLRGDINPAWVEDRLVLIGYTSTVASDHFFTPYSTLQQGVLSTPGVIIHAQGASQLISAVLDGRPLVGYWPTAIELLWILLWSIAGGTAGFYLRQIGLFIIAEAIVIGLLIAACYGLFLGGVWVPLTPALLAGLITAVGTVLLDRANRGGYSQALYEQTKEVLQGMLNPVIKVDQAQKAQQVAEITNTTFFQDLQRRAKEIRERRDYRAQKQDADSP